MKIALWTPSCSASGRLLAELACSLVTLNKYLLLLLNFIVFKCTCLWWWFDETELAAIIRFSSRRSWLVNILCLTEYDIRTQCVVKCSLLSDAAERTSADQCALYWTYVTDDNRGQRAVQMSWATRTGHSLVLPHCARMCWHVAIGWWWKFLLVIMFGEIFHETIVEFHAF